MTVSESVSNHDLQRVTIFCGSHTRAIEGVQFAKTGGMLVVIKFSREYKSMFDVFEENKEAARGIREDERRFKADANFWAR